MLAPVSPSVSKGGCEIPKSQSFMQRDRDGVGTVTGLPSPFRSAAAETEYLAAYDATMRLWPVQYESRDIPGRFGTTHLVVCGPSDAPPIVLLHCFFTSLTIWAHNIADLSRAHRVYAPDVMGQPSRSIPDRPVRNRNEMAEWVAGVVDALGLRRFDLVGYSYGGFAALNYSIHAQDRLKKLILLSPVGGLVPPRAQFYIRGLLTALPGFAAPAMRSFFKWMFYQPNINRENVRPLADRVLQQMVLGRKCFRMGAIVPPAAFPDEELRGVRTPTLLLVGQQEALYDPLAAVERAQRLMPNIETQLIPQAGHDLPVGQPQAVNQRVLQFLKEHGQE